MPKFYIPKQLWKIVMLRAKFCCEYCKYPKAFCGDPFVLEHIIPLVLNGLHHLDNWAYACSGCNQFKHTAITAIDPITKETVPLFHPRKDQWFDHFKWSENLLMMEGLTPTGRATIERLKTNRPALINLRQVLTGQGHPPE